VLGGVALGAFMLTALTLVGVLGARHQPPVAAENPLQMEILFGSQPELEAALLTAQDLGGGVPGRNAVPVLGRLSSESHPAHCTLLLSDPRELISTAGTTVISRPVATAQARSEQRGPDDSLLHQVLTTFAENGAVTTFNHLRQVSDVCRDFSADLDDGTKVRVSVVPVEPERIPDAFRRLSGETYVFKLTMTARERVTTGYLAVGRAGKVLSVLRQFGTARVGTESQSTTDGFLRLLEVAATKLTPATPGSTASSVPSASRTTGTGNTTVIVTTSPSPSASSRLTRWP
jgi:hypothetical protein